MSGNIATLPADATLLALVSAGLPRLRELHERVLKLPAFHVPGKLAGSDDSEVFDRLAATKLLIGELDGIPVAAIAALLSDWMFGFDEEAVASYEFLEHELSAQVVRAARHVRRRAMTILARFPTPAPQKTIEDPGDRLDTLLSQLSGLAGCVEALGRLDDDDDVHRNAIYTVGWVMRELADQAGDALTAMRACK